jgi:ketosteroid isomerase-like protein
MSDPFKSEDIASLYRTFEIAVGKKDVDSLLAKFYAPDVAFAGTGLPLTQGAAVKNVLAGLCGVARSVRVEQLQTLVAEPGKVLVDFAVVHVEAIDGSKVKDRSTCVFKKGPDGWRCIADVFIRD